MKGFEQPVRPRDRKCKTVLGHEIKRVLVIFRIYTLRPTSNLNFLVIVMAIFFDGVKKHVEISGVVMIKLCLPKEASL